MVSSHPIPPRCDRLVGAVSRSTRRGDACVAVDAQRRISNPLLLILAAAPRPRRRRRPYKERAKKERSRKNGARKKPPGEWVNAGRQRKLRKLVRSVSSRCYLFCNVWASICGTAGRESMVAESLF